MGEDAKTFDDLTPEESKSRLAIIVDKIDKDKNGIVTATELQEWIKFTQKRYIYEVQLKLICQCLRNGSGDEVRQHWILNDL